jgi:glycerol uptake facilitator-like aquaporin
MLATTFGSGALCCCELISLPPIWFTASTSFANPAVTIARSLSNTFAGIRPSDLPLFIVAQIAGALCATFLFRRLVPNLVTYADQVVVPHSSAREPREINQILDCEETSRNRRNL